MKPFLQTQTLLTKNTPSFLTGAMLVLAFAFGTVNSNAQCPVASTAIISTNGGSVVCQPETGVIYSTAAIPGATSYIWVVPSSLGTVTAGAGTASITVNISPTATSGAITVAGVNGSCVAGGPAAPFDVSVVTAAPAISGNTTISCLGSTTTLAYPAAVSTGTLSFAGGYAIHTFTATGTTASNYTFTPSANLTAQYLVIGAGGAGGEGGTYSWGGLSGGGGAGGYRCSVAGELSGNNSAAESPLALLASSTYAIIVGGGGSPGASLHALPTNGGNSSISGPGITTVTSLGGGYGGSYNVNSGAATSIGGSGGGGGQGSGLSGSNGAAGTASQGFGGGRCNGYGGGGGGGAGAVGSGSYGSNSSEGGYGGNGIQSSITGSPVYRAGGGAGGTHTPGTAGVPLGGLGGGGNGHYDTNGTPGTYNDATNGTDGTGGGGGGGGDNAPAGNSGFGGSGIVVMRYLDYSGGTWSSSNSAVASVDGSGVVTGNAEGSAVISYVWSPSVGSCTFTSTATVNVTSSTVATASVSPNPACATTGTVILTGGPAAATSYNWAGPGAYSSSMQTATVPAPVAAGTYTLTVVNGTCGSATATTVVTLTSTGVTATGTISGSNLVCSGQATAVYSTSIAAATTYNWTVPGTLGVISGASNGNSITVTLAGTPSGAITVSGANACGTGPVSPAFNVSVVTAAPAISGSTTISCLGSTTTLAYPTAISNGTLSFAGGYAIHTFTATGTTASNYTFTPSANLTAQYLVIGGGGPGGEGGIIEGSPGLSGGGGAGGYRCSVAGELSGKNSAAESPLALLASSTYAITVGGGGSPGGSLHATPTNGGNSSISGTGITTVTSLGGGAGGTFNVSGGAATNNGGSGGGGGQGSGTGGSSGAAGTANQGFAGGNCNGYGGGGGGGAGAAGAGSYGGSPNPEGGYGGNGIQSSITGTPVYRAGGGAGGTHTPGSAGVPLGGLGGGGNGHYDTNSTPGANNNATNGTDGTGGGGGGGGDNAPAGNSGFGGSGIVVMRYLDYSGGTWSSSNTAIASVNPSTGVVTGNALGSATINYVWSPSVGSCAFTSTATVTVQPLTVTATATTPVCTSGSNSTLTLTGSPSGATSYLWTGPNGFSSTAQSPVINGPGTAAAGIYTLTVVDGTCNSTNTSNAVVVNPTVTTSGVITGPSVVCANTSGNIYSTAPIANAVSYTWAVPGGATIVGAATNNSISVTFNASPSAGNITVIGNSAATCTTNATLTATYPITVSTPLPASSGITTTNGAVVCSGGSGIVYSAAAIAGAINYVWSVPSSVGTISGTTNGASITVTAAASPTGGTITVAGVNTCGSSGSTVPYIVSGPTAPLISGNLTLTCVASTTQLNVLLATGGTPSFADGYVIHTFTATGTTASNYTFTPSANLTAQYLVIGGGGAGGEGGTYSWGGLSGGGGAGGYRCSVAGELSGKNSSAESPLALSASLAYSVTVGGGGSPGASLHALPTNGGNSAISGPGITTVTSLGGGYGGSYNVSSGAATSNGGSGGGGGQGVGTGGSSGAAGTANQGFAGGNCNGYGGGGGGGAGAAGSGSYGGSPNPEGGYGGNGIQSSITGSPVYRAGGGAGGTHTPGTAGVPLGGLGGGGNGHYDTNGTPGTYNDATNGTDGTGGGGGGGGDNAPAGNSGFGGSGIVIIRYLSPVGTWSSSNAAVATVDNTGLVTGHANGSSTITFSYTPANSTCVSTNAVTVTVATPTLSVSPVSSICNGATQVPLTVSGAGTYTWSPATYLSASTGSTVTAAVSQLTFFTVTGTSVDGCTTNAVVPVATVPVGGTVTPAFSIICSGGTQTLNAVGAEGGNYQWQSSTDGANWGYIVTATNFYDATPTVNTYYRLVAQSNACWNVASTTAEVDISNPTITVTASNITDNSITLNWSPTGTGNYSISYSGASSGTLTSVTPPKTITGLTAEGTYSITVTQTGIGACSASGTITGEDILCAMPIGVTLSSPAPAQIQVSWTGTPGADYRVYYRPLFSYNTYFTKDVSNASSVLLTKQGTNNLYASTTYEVYVSRLDCPTTGAVGQGTNPANVTTLPTVTCATPQIDSVRSLCPVQIEVFMHDNGVNQYNVFIQRITPSILAVNSYGVSGTYFTINTPYSGDQYLIAVEAKCGSALSSIYVYPGNVTIKPLCTSPNNLVLSNPTCHGFTASWNADQCLSNSASAYDLYLRVAGTINYNSYGATLPANGIGPNKLVNWLTPGRTYQVFVRSVYDCNGFVTYGPTSQVETMTTLSSGCRDEDTEQPQENKPAVQQYSTDNQEVFSLYPNPNSGEFMVDLSRFSMEEEAVRIEVVNMMGQTILTHLTSISAGHMSEYINLPRNISAGTYIVRLTAGSNVYTSKIIISK